MTEQLVNLLKKEFSVSDTQVTNVIRLFDEGATIPFIARYRKEMTGSLDEIVLRNMRERYDYFLELSDRKETILKTIEEQGKLTPELKLSIENCLEKTKLEDIYLPFKPKRKTRATTARDKGLEPLYSWLIALNDPAVDITVEAAKYINEEKGVKTAADALAGAADIFAEQIAETAEYREHVRQHYLTKGIFVS
ncbi:MAG: RNA-binding transcriptional accessory protein, partial [Fibrobacteres bacterium]|nr:RNA-binding transcriptional accessory protein [Fibrobacterota bacterium]